MSNTPIDKPERVSYDSSFGTKERKVKELREILERKREQFQKLDREIEVLEVAIELVEKESIVTEKMDKLSVPQLVAAILEDAGQPLHTHQIRALLSSKGREISKDSLSSALFQYAKRRKLFYKVEDKPNTYGLRRWQGRNVDQEIIVVQ